MGHGRSSQLLVKIQHLELADLVSYIKPHQAFLSFQ